MTDMTPISSGNAVAGVLQNFSTSGVSYLLALWLGDPGSGATAVNNGTTIKEIVGGSYARQIIQFGAPNSAGDVSSLNAQVFTAMPAGPFDHIAVFDSTGSTYIWGGPLTGGSVTVTVGTNVNFVVGAVQAQAS